MSRGPGRPIAIAVVGCGYWGMNYLRVFSELPESQVAAVCDQKPERLREAARHARDAVLTTQLGRILSDPAIDAVVVCTDATNHHPVAQACLQARKHVLLEKPMTRTVAQAENLAALAESVRKTLMVGHTFLYNPGIRKVKELITARPARIYYMHACRTNLGPVRMDVNAVWDLATHDIAIFNYLLDEVPSAVNAIGARVLGNCHEDVAFISLFYKNKIVGHIHVSWADPNKAREVVVVCSDRRIVFNDLNGLEQVRVFEKGISALPEEPVNFGEFHLQIRDGDILSPRIKVSEPLKEECRHFLECAADGAQPPATGGWQGRDVVRVLEAIDRSMALSGAQVEVTSHGKYFQAAAD